MSTPYDRLQELREVAGARQRAALAQAKHEREKAVRQVATARSAAERVVPQNSNVAEWQVADAAQAHSLILLHAAEEMLRSKESELEVVTSEHVVAVRDEKIVSRMKERYLNRKREEERRREDRNIDDFNATKLFREMAS